MPEYFDGLGRPGQVEIWSDCGWGGDFLILAEIMGGRKAFYDFLKTETGLSKYQILFKERRTRQSEYGQPDLPKSSVHSALDDARQLKNNVDRLLGMQGK